MGLPSRFPIAEGSAEFQRILRHAAVIKEHITGSGSHYGCQFFELSGLILITPSIAPVKTKIAFVRSFRFTHKRINYMPQPEPCANRTYHLRIPASSRFPTQI